MAADDADGATDAGSAAAASLGVLLFLASIASLVLVIALLCEKQSCELRANPPGSATAHALAQHAPARLPTRAPARQGVSDFSQNDQIAGLMGQLERAR